MGAAILDDVMGVVLLALLYEFSIGGGVTLGNAGKVIMFVAAFFIMAPAAAKLMSAIIKHVNTTTEIPGLIPTTIVSLVLFFAWLAHSYGGTRVARWFRGRSGFIEAFLFAFWHCIACRPVLRRVH